MYFNILVCRYSVPAALERSAWDEVVNINETESSFLDVFKFVCVRLTTQVADQEAVVEM